MRWKSAEERGAENLRLDEGEKLWQVLRIITSSPRSMHKNLFLLALATGLVTSFVPVASAYDDDPGYGAYRPWFGGDSRGASDRHANEIIYYRPSQRYYAKGFTVNYRYLPVYAMSVGDAQEAGASNFRTEAFRITPSDVAAWGAKSPRLIVANGKAPKLVAITAIVPPTPVVSPAQASGGASPVVSPATPISAERPVLATPNLDPSPVPPVVPAAPVAPVVPKPSIP